MLCLHTQGSDAGHFPEEQGGGGGKDKMSMADKNKYFLGPVNELPYEFADPCPVSMRKVNIADLSSVNINWKMLTLARPDNKTDEEIFSK